MPFYFVDREVLVKQLAPVFLQKQLIAPIKLQKEKPVIPVIVVLHLMQVLL